MKGPRRPAHVPVDGLQREVPGGGGLQEAGAAVEGTDSATTTTVAPGSKRRN